jgi:hypothetical protein
MKTECYGAMFPPVAALETNREVRGKVFSYHLLSRGLGLQDRKVDADAAQWAACLACPDFDGCYALSLGKLALEQAVAGR